MGLARAALLAGSRNRWLRERACRWRFVRRSVSRFMPGETMDDALAAARGLGTHGIGSILTYLGENITSIAEAEAVAAHYVDVLGKSAGIDSRISVKLTQLGLDLGREECLASFIRLVQREKPENTVWIDMESSAYVDATLEIFRRARERVPN